ncbi:hypothetical protein TNCV_4374951 [Trichonephila clavipes]|uniref:Uncharacterized protein n=1 Tax=Trichonephila clavipes TaxID=2585209 RepID=A0A8X7BDK8_TRICX|nr:hypothetical protein TNCV_4374951 [Trichonephila clavipes]
MMKHNSSTTRPFQDISGQSLASDDPVVDSRDLNLVFDHMELLGKATTTNMLVDFDYFCDFIDIFDYGPACARTATAGSDVVQSGRPIFDDFFQHLWPYIGNNTANVVFQIVKRL